MARDIDYAAIAVKRAVLEKYAAGDNLDDLAVDANDRFITVSCGQHRVVGTRDDLMMAVRKATTLEEFWALGRPADA